MNIYLSFMPSVSNGKTMYPYVFGQVFFQTTLFYIYSTNCTFNSYYEN